MKYLRVKIGEKKDYFTGHVTTKNELVTLKERNRKYRYLMDEIFEEVEVSQKNICYYRGIRFEKGFIPEKRW